MGPTKRRYVRQKLWWAGKAGLLALRCSVTQVQGIPVNDDCSKQIKSCHAVVLTFGGTVANFALPANAQGALQSRGRLPLIQANFGATLHVDFKNPFVSMRRIIDYARGQGIKEVYGDVLGENTVMLKLCKVLSFMSVRVPDDPSIVRVTLKLD